MSLGPDRGLASERARLAAHEAYAEWTAVFTDALGDVLAAATPIVVAAELRRLANTVINLDAAAALKARADELDPAGVES